MIRTALASALLAAACTPAALPVQEERGPAVLPAQSPSVAPSQAASGPGPVPSSSRIFKPIGKPLTISFPGAAEVTLKPSEVQLGGKVGCAVTLVQPDAQPQTIITIGEGETEALTCSELKAAGRVPAPPGMQRIAFLYETFAPHATLLQPVIMARGSGSAKWRLDDELAQRIGENGSLNTIPALRRWLEHP